MARHDRGKARLLQRRAREARRPRVVLDHQHARGHCRRMVCDRQVLDGSDWGGELRTQMRWSAGYDI